VCEAEVAVLEFAAGGGLLVGHRRFLVGGLLRWGIPVNIKWNI
jgi:hypothetical protein